MIEILDHKKDNHMIQKITEKELQFVELLHDPIAVLENIVPKNVDAPSSWKKEEECIRIRLYQVPTLSYEYMVANDPTKTDQENFDLKKNAGQGYNIGGRKFGKSFITLFADALLTVIHYSGKIVALASFDHKHMKKIMEDICNYVELHPFFKIYSVLGQTKTVSRSPYKIQTRHGLKFYGINENILGKTPGTDYHQHHYHKFFYEEASYESEDGHQKRVDSTSELGAIERLSGIPDVTDSSYLGKILDNPARMREVIRLPQYVRHTWNAEQKKLAVEEHSGEGSIGYKLNVKGERIEGAYGMFDMERLKECYNHNRKVKQFSVSKDDVKGCESSAEIHLVLESRIILDEIPAEKIYICADIGDQSAPTEIIIVYKMKDRYTYVYNITLQRLVDEEQYEVFYWLYQKLNGAFIGLDCSDGTGRAIYRRLAKKIDEANLEFVHFSKNIKVGLEEKNGKVLRDKKTKKAILKEENVMNWADKQLASLLYKKELELYLDDKVYVQFQGYRIVEGKRKRTKEDHLLQAFQVLAITIFTKERQKLIKKKRKLGVGAV